MSKAREFPSMQPFNVTPRPNKTKRREKSWWGHPPFNNNQTQSKNKQV